MSKDEALKIAQLQLDLSTEFKRVSSYKILVESIEGQLSYYRDKDYKLSERRLDCLEQSLISEQQMNAILTDENAQLQLDLSTEFKRVSSYKMLVESLEGQLSHYRDKVCSFSS